MNAEELLRQVEQAGGSLALRGDRIVFRLPKDATPILTELKKHRDEVASILRSRESLSSGPAPEGDPYSKVMQAALREINRRDYPAGMIFWLEKAHPRLYRELTEYLPEDIHRLWEAHAPLEEFDRTLKRLISIHQEAVALYREHLRESGPPTGAL